MMFSLSLALPAVMAQRRHHLCRCSLMKRFTSQLPLRPLRGRPRDKRPIFADFSLSFPAGPSSIGAGQEPGLGRAKSGGREVDTTSRTATSPAAFLCARSHSETQSTVSARDKKQDNLCPLVKWLQFDLRHLSSSRSCAAPLLKLCI